MAFSSFYDDFRLNDEPARIAGFNPYYPKIQGRITDTLLLDGKEFINLASNNYLGLANDARVLSAAAEALEKYGVSMCSTPVAAGYSELYKEAEERMASFLKTEDSLLLPSCYQANNGIFKVIAQPSDLIVVDRSVHSSLIEGIRTVGCRIRPFMNNDITHLEEILRRSASYPRVFVVTESVFSTEGIIADFRQIYDLCVKYGAIPIVDDSHGIGVIGKHLRGILEFAGISDYQGIYLASIGKAMASSGGLIAGKESLMTYIRYTMPHILYSNALIPVALKAVIRVADIIDAEFSPLSARLRANTERLRSSLTGLGYKLTTGSSPIVSIRSGNSAETLMLARLMYDHSLLGTPFIYPSVQEKEGRMRLIAGAALGEDALTTAINSFSLIKKEIL